MAIQNLATLEQFFEAGDTPTEVNFLSLIQSNFVGNDKLETLSSTSMINPNTTFIRVESTGGAVTLVSNPQIHPGQRNQVIFLVGTSDTDYVSLGNGNGLNLSADCDLKENIVITLCYLADIGWYEVCRRFDGTFKADATDPSTGFLADKIQHSIVLDPAEHKIGLDGDVATPGNNHYYGTDNSGTRGWYALLSGGAISVKEKDGVPLLNNIGALVFDQDSGLSVTDLGSNAAEISFSVNYIEATGSVTTKDKDYVFANTAGGSFPVSLPLSPSLGDTVTILDASGTFESNSLSINRNGSNINGTAANVNLNIGDAEYKFIYVNVSVGWKQLIMGVLPSDKVDIETIKRLAMIFG